MSNRFKARRKAGSVLGGSLADIRKFGAMLAREVKKLEETIPAGFPVRDAAVRLGDKWVEFEAAFVDFDAQFEAFTKGQNR